MLKKEIFKSCIMPNENRPKVGVMAAVMKDNKILLGLRKNAHGEGEYACPGGHLEHMESVEECAKREIREESGLEVENVRFVRLLNFKDYAPKHYIDIAVIAEWKSGEPQLLEPEKCEGWNWYDLDNLPQPLFKTFPSFLEALETGKVFFDN